MRAGPRKSLNINNLHKKRGHKKTLPVWGGLTNNVYLHLYEFALDYFHVKRILNMVIDVEVDLAIKYRV